MASHKYFNYTLLINTPLCKAKTFCAKRKLAWLWIKLISAVFISSYANDKPAKRLVC